MMRLFILWYKDILSTPNLAYYKRIEYLSAHAQVFLLTRQTAHIDPGLQARLSVLRGPNEKRLPLWVPGLLRRNIELWWNYLRYSRWAIRYVTTQCQLGQGIVYTFQNLEARIGWSIRRRGVSWVVDVLDMPDLYLEYSKRLQQSGKRLRAFILRALFYKIFLMDRIFRDADFVFAIGPTRSEGCAAAMISEYGVDESRVFPTRNGVDLSNIVPVQSNSSEFHTPLRLCYVGRINPDRGISTMLAAVDLLKQAQIPVNLHLVGDVSRDYRERLPMEIHEHLLNDSVIVHGFLEHQAALAIIESSDICLYPFPQSPILNSVIPIKVLEYLALNKVVIASDLPGVRHVIQDGVNGLLVPPGDEKALAIAIRRLCNDSKLRYALSQNARHSVLKYDWNQINGSIFQQLVATFQIGQGQDY